jgi:hypothetical protein
MMRLAVLVNEEFTLWFVVGLVLAGLLWWLVR